MPHQELLTEPQRLILQTPASDERGMVRHYTLSSEDLLLINRRRGDPNRLGFAVMLCYLRFPGRILQQGEQPPAAVCAFIAEQLGLDATHFADYAGRDQTRREHVLEIQAAHGFHPLTRSMYRDLAAWLLPMALATDHGPTLVTTLIEELRTRQIICPPLPAIERLAASVRARAQRQLWQRLTDGLTDQQHRSLDQLLEVRVGGGQSTLAWLRQTAYAATTSNFPKLIERLTLVRALGIEPERATRVHQNYWLKLAREGAQSTVQHLAEFEPLRRYASLTALVLELTATLTDETLNMFEHLIGQLFKKSERAHADQFHASGKSINEKVRLYARIGQALIEARSRGGDAFAAIETVVPWLKFESTVAEAQTLAQPEDFDYLALLDERYGSVRRFAPLLLASFEFNAAPTAAELLNALTILRDLNASGKRTLPEHIPVGFVKPRWRPLVFTVNGVDRHFYELCALAELRDRLRSGDIWVTGSRQYRDFETYLIPAATFRTMQTEALPLDVDTNLPSYIAESRQRLEDNLTTVAFKAREKSLPDVTLTDGELRIAPLRKNTPESAEAFAEKAYGLMPHVKITELLAEVDQWTNLGDRFLHLRTQAPPKNRQALLTAVLADGINLGLTRMSEACNETTWRQLSWTADWHIREDCYVQALASLTDAQHRQPLANHWGSGTTSSSDAQFFRAGGRGEVGGLVNLHYGQEPGVKFYTHLSDQFGPYHTKVIAATANEAPHVLDGLLYHQSSLVINEHYTDTGGFSDHVFAMCRLLGFRFAPRIRDLKEKRLYLLPGMIVPPELVSMVAGNINLKVVTDHWSELLRLALSIKTGTVTASVILRKIAAYPRQNGLALALRELGKLERTLFTLQWLQDPELRRRSHVGQQPLSVLKIPFRVFSSDGLRFVVPVRTLHAGPNPKYFGYERGVTYYNLVSDQFTGLNAIVVPGTLKDSLSLLAVVLEQQTELQPTEIMTDTGAYTDVVFGLFWLLGYRFSPRIADIGGARYWRMDSGADYGLLNGVARHKINPKLVEENWDDALRLAGSLKLGVVQANAVMRTLQISDRPTKLAQAIAELGRIDKTIHALTFIDDERKRRRTLIQLNRGEDRHKLARAVFHGRRGELRQRYREGQEDQLGALGLVVNIIILWNTLYINAALEQLQAEGYPILPDDVARLSPLVFDHINLLGRYAFSVPDAVSRGELRSLRNPADAIEDVA